MNSAAFAPDDVDDARRGAPGHDLGAYAAARGLQPLGSVIQGHFLGLTPRFPEYTFNVLRGTFPGGRFGAIQHELYEIEMSGGRLRFNGELYGTRVAGRVSPSEFLGISVDRSHQPFGDDATLVPTTTLLVHAPEAVFLPAVLVRRTAFLALLSPSLQPAAPGFAMNATDHVDDALRGAIGAAMGPTLRSLRFPFVEVRLSYGRLALTVNGFVAAADQLDALVNAASALADAVAQLCSAWWAPDHFDTPLAPFDSAGHPRGWPSAMFTGPLDNSLTTSLQTIARDMRASIEDPVALHRRFPRLPIPGASLGVIAGRLPGTHAIGRLTWHFQNHHVSSMVRRGGAVFAARSGVADTSPGGYLVSDTDMYVAVRDGVAACWFREWTVGHFHSARLLEQALITLRGTGLADV